MIFTGNIPRVSVWKHPVSEKKQAYITNLHSLNVEVMEEKMVLELERVIDDASNEFNNKFGDICDDICDWYGTLGKQMQYRAETWSGQPKVYPAMLNKIRQEITEDAKSFLRFYEVFLNRVNCEANCLNNIDSANRGGVWSKLCSYIR